MNRVVPIVTYSEMPRNSRKKTLLKTEEPVYIKNDPEAKRTFVPNWKTQRNIRDFLSEQGLLKK